MDDILDTFSRAPRLLLRLGFFVMRILDYFGLLPQTWIERSKYHASLHIIDAGALNISPAYIQTGNFGTLPLTLSFGSRQQVYEMDKTGTVKETQHIICKASVPEDRDIAATDIDGIWHAVIIAVIESDIGIIASDMLSVVSFLSRDEARYSRHSSTRGSPVAFISEDARTTSR